MADMQIVRRGTSSRGDGFPVGNVESFSADPYDAQVYLTWVDPDDVVNFATWAGTKILRKTGSYPVDQNDGTEVVNSSVRDQYSSTPYIDTGLTNDTEYFYMAFPYTTDGAYTVNEANRVSATPKEASFYGLQWNQTTDTYTRLDNASTLTVGASIGGSAIVSDFDDAFPWGDIKRCNVANNGTVNAYRGDPTYVENGTNGQVMVEIPKFWYKAENDTTTDNIYRWWICDRPMVGYSVHPAFIRNGVEKDKIFFSAYEGNVPLNIMRSIAGVQPSGGFDVSDGSIGGFRGYAQARGAGWGIQDFQSITAIQLLYLIEFADFKTQTKIGRGVVDKDSGSGNQSNNTGATSFLGNASGRQSGSNGLTSISYRGIENFWGNIFKWVDGFNLNSHEVFVADHGFESGKFTDNYTSIGNVLSTSDTYIKDIIFGTADHTFLAKTGGGSSSTFLGDNWWVATGSRVALFGGHWNIASKAGGFCWVLHNAPSNTARGIGARLVFIP